MPDISRRGVLGVLAGSWKRIRRRPNFLFILGDDHAGYALGCAGNALASTPNLDRLAAGGTRFARHFCNSPVCTPSRQSMLTGLLPHAAGVTRLPTTLAADKPTLARQFQKAGYRTAVFGKMHFNRPAETGLHGFDVVMTEGELRRAWQDQVRPKPMPAGTAVKPPWKPFQDPARIWLNADGLPFARADSDMLSSYLVRKAAEFLEQNVCRPVALWASFQEPHSPFDFPVEDRGRFEPARFPVQPVGPADGWQIPRIFRDLSAADKRGIAASYYTSVAFLDRNIGRLLHTLRRLGLEEDTLVVYAGDNGYCLGHHGRLEKHCGYDPALSVPLIMRLPGLVRQGLVEDLTEHVDVAPTVTDLLGLDPLPAAQGRSLRPYLEGRRPEPREFVFSEYLENEEAFVRTGRWKYIHCSGRRTRGDGYQTDDPAPGRYWRLFDLEADPGEFRDVAAGRPDIAGRLRTWMLERFRNTHPDAAAEPRGLSQAEAVEFYLRPRDV